jgi:hypothetical protein
MCSIKIENILSILYGYIFIINSKHPTYIKIYFTFYILVSCIFFYTIIWNKSNGFYPLAHVYY